MVAVDIAPDTLAALGLRPSDVTALLNTLAISRATPSSGGRVRVPSLWMATVQAVDKTTQTASLTLLDTSVLPDNANLITGVPWFGDSYRHGNVNNVGETVWVIKQGEDAWIIGRSRDIIQSNELGYDSRTSDASITATSQTSNNVGLSVPVVVPGGRRIRVEFSARGFADPGNTVGTGIVALFEDGVMIKDTHVHPDSVTASWVHGPLFRYRRPSAGSHTYSVGSWIAIGSGTLTMSANSDSPAEITVNLD